MTVCCRDTYKQVFVSIQPTKMSQILIRLLKGACLVMGECIRHSRTVLSPGLLLIGPWTKWIYFSLQQFNAFGSWK